MAEGGHGDGGGHNPSWIQPLLRPFYHDHVPIYAESVALGIIVASGLVLGSYLLTRNMSKTAPSRKQALVETVVGGLDGFVGSLIGHDARRYLPLVGTLFLYILFMNLLGLVPGFASPTASGSVTAGLAIVVFLYVQYQGIRANGLGGYLMHFVGEPKWLFFINIPIHIIGELARPLSLTLRLFGNIFGEDFVIILLMTMGLAYFPIQFMVSTLAVFTSLVQALVFSILTCVYIASVTVHDDDHHGEEGDVGHGVIERHQPAPPV